ncbi:hypothetical protein DPMN_185886 [Dreissena polymorpha]|uniref:PHD-type domain-containing protein n=1 Tax=Dreissena polymorpha TaxID=45954 RepID=A0A9D4DLR3_DREPO|nr:hypothetical protein DPMN_185886 [Dreissena polymorpha]
MADKYPCVYCEQNIGEDDKVISCDECERWKHLSCETGVSLQQYRKMVKGEVVLEWKCHKCSRPVQMDVTPEVEVPMDATPEGPEILEANDISIISELSVESRFDEVEDRTFNISHREIEQPNMPVDDSVRERPLDAVIPEDGPITYDVVTGGTKRGGKKLASQEIQRDPWETLPHMGAV